MEDLSKLKVTELRAELQAKGLDTKGTKNVLIDRLREVLGSDAKGTLRVANDDDEEEENPDSALEDEQANHTEENQEDEQREGNVNRGGQDNYYHDAEDEHCIGIKMEPNPEELEDLGPKEGYEGEVVKQEVAELKYEVKEEVEETEEQERKGEKRKSPPLDERPDKKMRPDVEEVHVEDEPEFDKSVVALDWYNSDLSVQIEPEKRVSATPMTQHGFAYVWHGIRASLGFLQGRLCYEVRVDKHIDVPHLESDEMHPHVVRVGWSLDEAGLILGEEPMSWGYGGTGKASNNLKFKDYGKAFKEGDVVGCFLDMNCEPMVMSFTVNGEHQGICYEISHATIKDQAMFPHIVTKNCSFSVNFGAEEPWFETLPGYMYAAHAPEEHRVPGTQGPEKRADAEAIMMIGLPACGKTTWVQNLCKKFPDKKYNVLGTNDLIDKMKVMGLPRKRNYAGRWDILIDKCTKCLNTLLAVGYKRRRNFIIDQTNVYPTAQWRKIKGFSGFRKRAVVICPTDDDLRIRTAKREKEEGKDVPDKAVLEMKGNFRLPDDAIFEEIEYVELNKEEAAQLVEQYNREGEKAGFGPKKGRGGGPGGRRGERRGAGFGGSGRGNYRGGWDRDRDRRGGFDRRERGGGGGGWNRDFGGGRDYNRDYGNREFSGSRDYGGNRDYGGRGGYSNRDNQRGGSGYGRGGGSSSGGYNRNNSYSGSYNRDSGGYSRGGRGGGSGGGYKSQNDDYNRRGGSMGGGGWNQGQGGSYNQGSYNQSGWGGQQGYGSSSSSGGYGGGQSYSGGQGYGSNQGWGGSTGTSGYSSPGGGYSWNQQYYSQQHQMQPSSGQGPSSNQYWGSQSYQGDYSGNQGYGSQGYSSQGYGYGQQGNQGNWNYGGYGTGGGYGQGYKK